MEADVRTGLADSSGRASSHVTSLLPLDLKVTLMFLLQQSSFSPLSFSFALRTVAVSPFPTQYYSSLFSSEMEFM